MISHATSTTHDLDTQILNFFMKTIVKTYSKEIEVNTVVLRFFMNNSWLE